MKTAIAAHNAFTAKIVSSLGFDLVWGSSLEISTAYCLPDASIVSFDSVLRVAKEMVENSSVPVLMDCDSGYGNEVNVFYYFQELKKAGVKAVCIEDNIFPKQNSFYEGTRLLEEAQAFARKIVMAKRIFNGPDEFVVARTEALIQGMGVEEALRRATIYADAGADYVMPHSKQSTPDEIFEFSKLWKGKTKLVSVPSKYPQVTRAELESNGYDLVIYANHTVRTIKRALETTLPRILEAGTSAPIEKEIAPISEILAITGEDKVKELEAMSA